MTAKQKVLIVDDELRNLRIISEILDGEVEFQTATSGEEALEVVKVFSPDLILLDIMMSGLDGYEVCRQLKTQYSQAFTKVILVSGKAFVEERLKGYEVGADDYMTKPFASEELLAKVKVFLRLTQIEKQLNQVNQLLEEKVQERTRNLFLVEAQMMNSAKMSALGQMAGGIAHEINTPLGTIMLLSEQMKKIVQQEPIDASHVDGMSQVILNTVTRISVIIDGLRSFSRDGSQDIFVVVALKKIVSGVLDLCQEKMKNCGVLVKLDPEIENISLKCQQTQIAQVLMNLLNNAFDAIETLPDKWIQIGVQREPNSILVSVTDSGRGIAPEHLNKIFQPFYTTKDIGKGTGLGLSISKGIVESNGGTLSVEENHPHTRFVIRLPNIAEELIA